MRSKPPMKTTFSARRGDPSEGNLAAQTEQEWVHTRGYEVDEGNDREEKGIAWADEELMESRLIKNEPTFDLEELIC